MCAKNCRAAVVAASFLSFAAVAAETDVAKFDPRMAAENAVIDTNGVKWIDGRYLPIEGRAFDDTETYYERLPKGVSTNVNAGVRNMKVHTAGMQFRFVTDSKRLAIRFTPRSSRLAMDHMSSTGASGVDVYEQGVDGVWRFVRVSRLGVGRQTFEFALPWTPGRPCLVNLPLYNGIRDFALGIDRTAGIKACPPRRSGVTKPVVFYGTSITHGGCASRPGLSFVNIVGRRCDVPVVNLGFSGSGVMEHEMSEHLARIDASCYVLDCLWNMRLREKDLPGRAVETNYEPFIRNLRAKRPGVPIVMAEQCDVFCRGPNDEDVFIRALYEKLVAEGWKGLVYLSKGEMYAGDGEGTVDGCHPNDWGMVTMAAAYGKAVKKALCDSTND